MEGQNLVRLYASWEFAAVLRFQGVANPYTAINVVYLAALLGASKNGK